MVIKNLHSFIRGMTITSGNVVVKKDSSNLIGISIGGGAPYCPCLYIVQVFDNTPAAIEGTLQSGDELVAVNGASVRGKTKVEVAKMIQACESQVSINYNKLHADPRQGKTLDIALKKVRNFIDIENFIGFIKVRRFSSASNFVFFFFEKTNPLIREKSCLKIDNLRERNSESVKLVRSRKSPEKNGILDNKMFSTVEIIILQVKHRLVEGMGSATADALGLSRAILCNDALVQRLMALQRTENLYRGLVAHAKSTLHAFFDLTQIYKGKDAVVAK